MAKQVNVWVCEKCMRPFPSKQQAEECEKWHLEPTDIRYIWKEGFVYPDLKVVYANGKSMVYETREIINAFRR